MNQQVHIPKFDEEYYNKLIQEQQKKQEDEKKKQEEEKKKQTGVTLDGWTIITLNDQFYLLSLILEKRLKELRNLKWRKKQ